MKNNYEERDIILTCQRCGARFYFTVGEQRFYKQKGLNIPKYCKNCRQQKREVVEKRNIPRACSTCYFCGNVKDFVDTEVFPLKPGEYRPAKIIYLHVCTRVNRPIINDKPCKAWTNRDY